jgi:hypothetical protein
MWILLIMAVHMNNPEDVPGRVWIEYPTEESCRAGLKSMKSWLKFDSFRVTAHCEKKK